MGQENITGQRIEELMKEQGIKQQDLAEKIHVSPSSVSLYVSGKRCPKANAIKAIAYELGTTVDYLMGAPPPDTKEEIAKAKEILRKNRKRMTQEQMDDFFHILCD